MAGMARRRVTRLLIALVVTMLVGSLGDHTQPAAAQEGPDPALVLLASYNIPPTDEFLPLLNEAAGRLAATHKGEGADTGPDSAKAVIAAAVQDRAVRLKLTPHLLAVAMDAVATRNPTPTQEAFYRYFQRYYADQHQRVAKRTLDAWNEFRGPLSNGVTVTSNDQFPVLNPIYVDEGLRPQPANTTPLSVVVNIGQNTEVKAFTPPANLLDIRPAGAIAVVELFGPMALSQTTATANDPVAASGQQTAAALASVGDGQQTAYSVYVSLASEVLPSAGSGFELEAWFRDKGAALAAQVAARIALMVAQNLAGTVFGVIGAGVFAIIGALVTIAQIVEGKVNTANFQNDLIAGASKPDYGVDLHARIDIPHEQDAGLWYPVCKPGHRGVATRCYQDCDPGFVDDGLLCRRPPDSFGKPSYQRGVEILQCAPGLVNDAGLCYTPCPPGFRGVATLCYADCPTGTVEGTRLARIIFRDDGLFCFKLIPTYGRGVGYPWQFGDAPFDYSNTIRRCERDHGVGNCSMAGLIAYPNCAAGFATHGLLCSQQCPAGFVDIGISCGKATFGRGIGVPIDSCAAGYERFGALCYPLCNTGYSSPPGLPNTCMSQAPCPAGYNDTGFTCLRNLYVYGKSWYDRGGGKANPPDDKARQTAKLAVFNYLVKLMVVDPAQGDRYTVATPPTPQGSPGCPPGFALVDATVVGVAGKLCGQVATPPPTVTTAATIKFETVTEGTGAGQTVRFDVSGSVPTTSSPVTYTWDFGDGTTATGPTTTHAYPKPGVYKMVVTATDTEGRSNSHTTEVTVLAAPPSTVDLSATAHTVDEGSTLTVNGSFNAGDPTQAHTVRVDWGAGLSEAVPLPAGTTTFALPHVYPDNGVNEIKVAVVDSQNLQSQATVSVAVRNVAPSVIDLSTTPGALDEPARISATIADPGIADTVTVFVDWDDGNGETFAVPTKAGPFTATHQYTVPGTFKPEITVTDDEGDAGKASIDVQVRDLQPPDRIQRAIDQLKGTTDPALVTVLRELDGSNGGRSTDGAIDQLARGNLPSALGHLRKAAEALAGQPTNPLLIEFTKIARELTVDAVDRAALAAPDAPAVAQARRYLAAAETFAAADRPRDAINQFQKAATAVWPTVRPRGVS